jgi:hypothetical protein
MRESACGAEDALRRVGVALLPLVGSDVDAAVYLPGGPCLVRISGPLVRAVELPMATERPALVLKVGEELLSIRGDQVVAVWSSRFVAEGSWFESVGVELRGGVLLIVEQDFSAVFA